MKKTWSIFAVFCSIVLTFGLDASESKLGNGYPVIEWADLIPADDLEALLNPPEAIYEIEDGSSQDNLSSLDELMAEEDSASRYYEALKSSKVVESFDGKTIKLPGFVVPLVSDEENKITEFFIVPYFGACLHMPPPPPNQIIYGKVEKGFILNSLYDPFWFEGKISLVNTSHEMGESAYSIDADSIYLYEE